MTYIKFRIRRVTDTRGKARVKNLKANVSPPPSSEKPMVDSLAIEMRLSLHIIKMFRQRWVDEVLDEEE